MIQKNKEFVRLMLEKSKEKTDSKAHSPFKNIELEKVKNITKKILEKKKAI
jgi:hypothetical protein